MSAGVKTYAKSVTENGGRSPAAAVAATLVGTGTADFTFANTAGARTAGGVADTDFSGGKTVVLVVKVDGGANQTITLNTDLTNVAGVKTAANAQITGAVFTGAATLVLTSSTTGPSSSIQIVSETDSGASSLHFSAGTTAGVSRLYTATLRVDGSQTLQTITLNADYNDVTALKVALNAQTTGAVWTGSGTLTLTSSTTGTKSVLEFTAPVAPAKDIKLATASSGGTAAIYGGTELWTATGGSVTNPQQVVIQNAGIAGTDHAVAIGAEDLTYATGYLLLAGGTITIPLLALQSVWARANTSDTIDVRVLVTEA